MSRCLDCDRDFLQSESFFGGARRHAKPGFPLQVRQKAAGISIGTWSYCGHIVLRFLRRPMNSCWESKGPPTNHPTSSERDLQDVDGRETFLLGAKLMLKLVSSR